MPPPPGPERLRLDRALVGRGLARSRGHARELVDDGHVTLDGVTARKAGLVVAADVDIQVTDGLPRWVGRAAGKLDGALRRLGETGPQVRGGRCIDLGASTGGFTQVLLERGAAHVVALDVGHDQLAPALRDHPRVTDRSGTTVRGLSPEDVGAPFDLVVADLSFISLRLVLPEVAGLMAADGDAVLLLKPQFEVGREGLGPRGVVRDPGRRRDAVLAVLADVVALELSVLAVLPSDVVGSEGNREYVVHLTRRIGVGRSWQALRDAVDELVGAETR